jgi:precorrin-4 methylase
MSKKRNTRILIGILILLLPVCFLLLPLDGAEQKWSIGITGLVKQPLNLTAKDLGSMSPATVRLNEMSREKEFRGSFNYAGVPLKQLLEMASFNKEGSDFSKAIDLAILVRNKEGACAALSWGEVSYRNPGDVIIAYTHTPIIPGKACSGCHTKEEYEKWWAPLHREIAFPKLVIAGDFYTERCLEGVCSIEIVDPSPAPQRKPEKRSAPSVTINGAGVKPVTISSLPSSGYVETTVKQVGDGRGYHGMAAYRGVPLASLLEKVKGAVDPATVFVLTAPDGYRSILSAGELFYSARGNSVLLADMLDGAPITSNGKFHVVVPDDLGADRCVKSVERIEMISLRGEARISIAGMGCGDSRLASLEAISCIMNADAVACADDLRERFARYIGDKPVLFDPLMGHKYHVARLNPSMPDARLEKLVSDNRKNAIETIRKALAKGKHIAFLEYGDPSIYGSWSYWLRENFPSTPITVVPGISAFNAGNAMIGKNVAVNGSVVLTTPNGIRKNEEMVKAVAKNGDTLAIFVGLKDFHSLVPILEKYFDKKTPVAIAYKAGYRYGSKLVRTTLGEAASVIASESERHLGLVYIGSGL